MFTLNCKGKLLVIDKPLVMGIINVTPDSFYEGYLNKGMDEIKKLAERMIAEGADILDIGGQSTKPGSTAITAEEELKRVIPAVEAIHKSNNDIIISIDSYYSKVAAEAVAAGASIVNDISAGSLDKEMLGAVAKLKTPYICMHMQGIPANMQNNPQYNDVVKEVLDFFIAKLEECRSYGIEDVIIDPGFGFGKTIQHNFRLLKNLEIFSVLQKPLLAGISRKGLIYRTLGTTAVEALNGTTVLNTIALMNGASLLRVHDVKQAKEAIKLFEAYQKI